MELRSLRVVATCAPTARVCVCVCVVFGNILVNISQDIKFLKTNKHVWLCTSVFVSVSVCVCVLTLGVGERCIIISRFFFYPGKIPACCLVYQLPSTSIKYRPSRAMINFQPHYYTIHVYVCTWLLSKRCSCSSSPGNHSYSIATLQSIVATVSIYSPSLSGRLNYLTNQLTSYCFHYMHVLCYLWF